MMNDVELEMCIRTYGKEIYSFCSQLTKSRQEADDLYQDTFLKMLELRERIDIKNNPKNYLISISIQLWKNRKRKFAWRRRITGQQISIDNTEDWYISEQEPLENQMISRDEQKLVQKSVSKLPEKYRIPILLYYMEELKICEIAKLLKIPPGTVKSRLHKAKQLLKQELEVVLNERRIG